MTYAPAQSERTALSAFEPASRLRPARSGKSDGGHTISYRPDIDGLRAIAVTSVVVYHIWNRLLPGGFVGVDVFFVISGFLIGGNIHREVGEGRFSFANFYARRARRILPALLAMMALFLLFGLWFFTGREYRELSAETISTTFGVSNIQFWLRNDYFAADAALVPLLMTWSLGVEEQFYIGLPVLMLLTERLRFRGQMVAMALITLLSFAASIEATLHRPWAAFYLIPYRAWELGLGVMLALWDSRSNRIANIDRRVAGVFGVGGLALIVAALVAFDDATPFPGLAALVPVLGSLALIVGMNGPVNQVLLSCRPMVGIGLISYSWYLWHWPILTVLHSASASQPTLAAKVGFSVLGLLAAAVSWRFVEQPVRRRRASTSRTLLTALAAMTGLALFAGLGVVTYGFSARLSTRARQIDQLAAAGAGDCQLGFGAFQIGPDPHCRPDPGNRRIVAVIGDSHANAFGRGIAAVLPSDRYVVWQVEKSACLPLLDIATGNDRIPAHAGACASFLTSARALLRDDPRVAVVMLAGAWPARNDPRLVAVAADGTIGPKLAPLSSLEAGLGGLADELRHAGKRVIVIGDVPRIGDFDPMRAARIRAMPLRGALSSLVAEQQVAGDTRSVAQLDPDFASTAPLVRDIAARHADGYFSIAAALCDSHACRIAEDGLPLFIDRSHLSKLGTSIVLASTKCRGTVRPPACIDIAPTRDGEAKGRSARGEPARGRIASDRWKTPHVTRADAASAKIFT